MQNMTFWLAPNKHFRDFLFKSIAGKSARKRKTGWFSRLQGSDTRESQQTMRTFLGPCSSRSCISPTSLYILHYARSVECEMNVDTCGHLLQSSMLTMVSIAEIAGSGPGAEGNERNMSPTIDDITISSSYSNLNWTCAHTDISHVIFSEKRKILVSI